MGSGSARRMQLARMRDNETIICVTDPYLDGVWKKVDSMQHLETNVTGVGTTAVVRVFNRVSLGGTITFDTDQTDFSTIVIKFDNDDGVSLEQSSRIQILESSVGVRLILVQDLLSGLPLW